MANDINIGDFDTLVTILKGVKTSTAQGAKGFTYTAYRQVFGKVDLNVSETVENTNLEQGQYIQLSIYKIDSLTTRWRVVVNGETYEITGIDPISRSSRICTLTLHSVG